MKTAAIAAISTTRPIESVFHDHLAQCVLELFSEASVAVDGSKFKAVNTRDRNFTQAKMQRRLAQIDESIARYLSQLDSADRQGEAVPEAKITRLNEKIATLRESVVGSSTDLTAPKFDFRSSLESGLKSDVAGAPRGD